MGSESFIEVESDCTFVLFVGVVFATVVVFGAEAEVWGGSGAGCAGAGTVEFEGTVI